MIGVCVCVCVHVNETQLMFSNLNWLPTIAFAWYTSCAFCHVFILPSKFIEKSGKSCGWIKWNQSVEQICNHTNLLCTEIKVCHWLPAVHLNDFTLANIKKSMCCDEADDYQRMSEKRQGQKVSPFVVAEKGLLSVECNTISCGILIDG